MYMADVHQFDLVPGIKAEMVNGLMTVTMKRRFGRSLSIMFPIPVKPLPWNPLHSNFIGDRFLVTCGNCSIEIFYHRDWPNQSDSLNLLVDIMIDKGLSNYTFRVAIDEESESGIRIIQNR